MRFRLAFQQGLLFLVVQQQLNSLALFSCHALCFYFKSKTVVRVSVSRNLNFIHSFYECKDTGSLRLVRINALGLSCLTVNCIGKKIEQNMIISVQWIHFFISFRQEPVMTPVQFV